MIKIGQCFRTFALNWRNEKMKIGTPVEGWKWSYSKLLYWCGKREPGLDSRLNNSHSSVFITVCLLEEEEATLDPLESHLLFALYVEAETGNWDRTSYFSCHAVTISPEFRVIPFIFPYSEMFTVLPTFLVKIRKAEQSWSHEACDVTKPCSLIYIKPSLQHIYSTPSFFLPSYFSREHKYKHFSRKANAWIVGRVNS